MLILCIGPDTYRAMEKGRELEQAFRQKFDPEGTSVERLWARETSLADQVIERANTISLFTPRRFMRTTDLVSSCAKTKQQALSQALSKDPENVIVVSVEQEMPSEQAMKLFSAVPKFVRYDFPLMSEAIYAKWVQERAAQLSIQDEKSVRLIVEQGNGDAWFASNELIKLAAGGTIDGDESTDGSSWYEVAEAFIQARPEWRARLLSSEEISAAMPAFLAQVRSFLRVRDGAEQGLPSFVVRKMQRLKTQEEPERRLAKIILYYFIQRSGLGDEEESSAVL